MSSAITLIGFVCFATSLFVRSVDPVMPQIATALTVDIHTAALLSTAFSLPYAIVQPVLGALADMLGKTRLMMTSLFVLVLAGLACALATSFPVLLAARVVAGIASGGVFPVGLAMVGDLVPVEGRQVAIGRVLAATMTGNLLGASLAGIVGDLIGWRGVFVVTGLIGALVFAMALYGFRRVTTPETPRFDRSSIMPGFRAIFTNPLAKICFGSVFLEGIALFGVFPYVATLLVAQGELRASIAGVVIAGFGLGGVLYSFTVALMLRHIGERGLMIGGGLVMALGLLVVASGAPWPLQFVMFLALGFGFYMLHGCIQVYVTELAPSARASAMSLHSAFFFLGQGIGPVAYGAGLAQLGTATTLSLGAAMLTAIGFLCARWLKRRGNVAGAN